MIGVLYQFDQSFCFLFITIQTTLLFKSLPPVGSIGIYLPPFTWAAGKLTGSWELFQKTYTGLKKFLTFLFLGTWNGSTSTYPSCSKVASHASIFWQETAETQMEADSAQSPLDILTGWKQQLSMHVSQANRLQPRAVVRASVSLTSWGTAGQTLPGGDGVRLHCIQSIINTHKQCPNISPNRPRESHNQAKPPRQPHLSKSSPSSHCYCHVPSGPSDWSCWLDSMNLMTAPQLRCPQWAGADVADADWLSGPYLLFLSLLHWVILRRDTGAVEGAPSRTPELRWSLFPRAQSTLRQRSN